MKTMPKTTSEERFRWIKPILDRDITIREMTKVCPFSERTIKYWLSRYRESGISGLESESRRPKTQPQETSIRLKERVIELRKENKLSALKLSWKLKKKGIVIHPRTIGKIIKREGLTRKYRTKKVQYKYLKIPLKLGELVEIDIKYVPQRLNKKRFYQFTAIDSSSRWRYLKVYDEMSTFNAMMFLKELITVFPSKIKSIKTDNGSCFTNRYNGGYWKSSLPFPRIHSFEKLCQELGIIHYLIDPGKPSQNGKVERSHRSDQESFYDSLQFKSFNELQLKLKLWNIYYNDLEHCALNGKTPNQALRSGVQNVCT